MLLVLCGKSGSGKDTVANELLQNENYSRQISTTSRPMRDGEQEGREYFFVTKEEFLNKQKQNGFVEYRAYDTNVSGKKDTWYYGTETFEKQKGVVVAIKDLQGAKILKDYCEKIGEDCACVLIEVPDTLREQRASLRGSFDKTEWDRRVKADAVDFSEELIEEVIDIRMENVGYTPKELALKIKDYVDGFGIDKLVCDSGTPVDRIPEEKDIEYEI